MTKSCEEPQAPAGRHMTNSCEETRAPEERHMTTGCEEPPAPAGRPVHSNVVAKKIKLRRSDLSIAT
jgi:hypothetical protein